MTQTESCTPLPEGYDRLLWGDLITVFKPSKDDEVWKAQQDYTLTSWRLFDSCGIHVLLMDTGIAIHMLVEKTYPLTQEMLSRMLGGKLEVDNDSEMAFELLKFTRSQIENTNNNCNSSTNEVDNIAYGVSDAHTQCNPTYEDNLSDAIICAFLAIQPNSPQLAREELEQIGPDDLEEMDL
ncbi:hypothetical protein Tco_1434749, partial [Tanacetum coccineum]